MKTCIVVPCYQEEKRLELPRFTELFRDGARVLFVDDGSRDGTRAMLESFAAQHPGSVSVLALEKNSGKAEAVRRGLLEAIAGGAKVIGYLDADLATPPAEMVRLLDEAGRGAEVVLGSRVSLLGRHIERRPTRHYLGRVFATGASITLGLRVYDTQCGAKAFRVTPTLEASLSTPFQTRWVFDVELLDRLLRPAPGLAPVPPDQFVEVPLNAWRDVDGSKLGAVEMARAASDLLQLGWGRVRGLLAGLPTIR